MTSLPCPQQTLLPLLPCVRSPDYPAWLAGYFICAMCKWHPYSLARLHFMHGLVK